MSKSAITGYRITYEDKTTEFVDSDWIRELNTANMSFSAIQRALYSRCNANNSTAYLVEPLSRLFDNNPVAQEGSNIEVFRNYDSGFTISWSYSIGGVKSNKVAETPDMAYLLALEEKYLGNNHHLARYVAKLLNIPSQWAK